MFHILKKSLVIKCYTPDFTIYEGAPLTMKSNKDLFHATDQPRSIRTCYGYIKALKKSITVPNWSEFRVVGTDEGVTYEYPEKNRSLVESHNDPCLKAYGTQVTKLCAPWAIESNLPIDIVVAPHVLNSTPMRIPSGCMTFYRFHQLNMFNYVHKAPHEYEVPFGLPLVSLFPMTERRIVLETYYDPDKFHELNYRSKSNPFFRGGRLKLDRLQG
jgi:hypothetical protein|tara:strand:- start:175 stop:819 length:645 start_codon:yes stop_codon:yes gene_type:complete